MTNTDLKEIYTKLEGNYDVMLKRLRNEVLIRSFLDQFLEDEEFAGLEKAMAAGDDSAAFHAAHTLKGVALNMEFGFLARSVSELTEALRHGRQSNVDELYETVRNDYHRTVSIIRGEA